VRPQSTTNKEDCQINPRAIIRASRRTAASVPPWVLPFYWASAACLLLFAGMICLVGALCMSMRPLYERRT
jgi:hypothetical protein